uniref:Uncharacterized protein n=1 Tax=Chelydra serpentina TaxID=8475 RepID=A0A8C3TJR7_CHESE
CLTSPSATHWPSCQWHWTSDRHTTPQPKTPELKRSASFSLPSSWDYRCAPHADNILSRQSTCCSGQRCVRLNIYQVVLSIDTQSLPLGQVNKHYLSPVYTLENEAKGWILPLSHITYFTL